MRTFDDLVFKNHPNGLGGKMAQMKLKNGYTISVVGGKGLYGNGINSFEVAIFDRQGEFVQLQDHDSVLGYQSKDDVTNIIQDYDNKPNLSFDL